MKTNELIGFMIAGLGAFYCILGYYTGKINDHISRLEGKIENNSKRTDGRLNSQNARTDQLYQMFCDLLKERK